VHLLAASPGTIEDGSAPVDPKLTPGELLFLSTADSEIACLAAAQARLADSPVAPPRLRLARLGTLAHSFSIDLLIEQAAVGAKLIVARILGGRSYWPYGVERLAALARERRIALALLPGEAREDRDLLERSTVSPDACRRLAAYFEHGGIENAIACLRYAAELIGRPIGVAALPATLPRAGLYHPAGRTAGVDRLPAGAPVAGIVFYRALLQSGDLAPVDAMVAALAERGIRARPIYVAGLKDPVAAAALETYLEDAKPDILLNATGFAVGMPDDDPLARLGCPVLQLVLAGATHAGWATSMRGLVPRDLVMSVVLPEIDGRVLAAAISFKSEPRRDRSTEADLVRHEPVADRVAYAADLAAAWIALRRTPVRQRKVAFVLGNYPSRDGRIGNGVGLDVPASMVRVLQAMRTAGYGLADLPADGGELIARLLRGPTNERPGDGRGEWLPRAAYDAVFGTLPAKLQADMIARWGRPEEDPFFRSTESGFAIAALRFGRVAVGLQPPRAYGRDADRQVHDRATAPPHGFLAFYVWLKRVFAAQSIVQMGKHGSLEWLPGKAVALSADCYPAAVLGPLPLLYPFIVNDPGEGTQAKRRNGAVIVDHLTPPLARAGVCGRAGELESALDEYYEAQQLDPRRIAPLAQQVLDLARASGFDRDCGISPSDTPASALAKLDTFLCEIKEMQIRDGLHEFGLSPQGDLRTGLLTALLRSPRGAAAQDASILRAIAGDLGLDGFDPLGSDLGAPWRGAKPASLAALSESPWRNVGDTRERIEALALELVSGGRAPEPEWTRTTMVLRQLRERIAPALEACGKAEIDALLAGLDGRFVPPGPSGAPTRGRPDVLPTGRNFYSLDSRAVPTAAAWSLGWKSAAALLERHAQEAGDWPRRIVLSAWGTSAMRTGGDDIAQALALLGVRPTWESSTGRVTGFEVLPATVLGRPRVDVTLRVSGFFRDAFPALIDLFDSAVRAVASLDEPEAINPLAAQVRADRSVLSGAGPEAERRTAARVFSSAPGAYGAGLQALVDTGAWRDQADLAQAFLAASGFAYGGGSEGEGARTQLEDRLRAADAVLHNQDNREHDILDSDDYYQFEGGLAASIKHLAGRKPRIWHNDHSQPDLPRVRALGEEIARVLRARAANPRWIAGAMRHGYKGGFEMAATVDYLFAFAATTGEVADHHFDILFAAYVEDETVRRFLEANNPAALTEMQARFQEAIERGLWQPRRNSLAATASAPMNGAKS
jgi:cobaltochelatase CobN